MSYSSFGYAFPAAPIGGGSAGSQQLLHSSRLTSFTTNNNTSNNNSNVLNNTDNASFLSVQCRLQLQGPGTLPGPFGGLHVASEGAGSGSGGLYGPGLITYPRPVHGGALTDSVYRSAYAAAAAAAHQGYEPLVAAVDSAASGAVCYPSMNADGQETWRTTSGGWPYHINMGVYPYTNSYGGLDVRRKNATRESTSTLKAWLYEHIKNPYPTKGEKIMLAIITKMTLTQVSTWFANARRRLKKENKMQWSPNKRSDEREGDDDDNDDNDDDDDERMQLNVADDDDDIDVREEPLQKLVLLKAMQEARTQANPIRHQSLDLNSVTSQKRHPPLTELSSVTHQLASHPPHLSQHPSSSASPSPSDLPRDRLPAKDGFEGPTKLRIWSLADVATRDRERWKNGVDAPCPLPPVSEPLPVRPKFQPWAEDNRWAAEAGRHPKMEDAVMRNQAQPPVSTYRPLHPHGTNIHWSFYRTLSTTAGPFSFGSHPVSFYLDKYQQSQLPVNATSLRDATNGIDSNRDGGSSDAAGHPCSVLVSQPISTVGDDGDADREVSEEEEEEENTFGDGGLSTNEENSTLHSSTRMDELEEGGLQ